MNDESEFLEMDSGWGGLSLVKVMAAIGKAVTDSRRQGKVIDACLTAHIAEGGSIGMEAEYVIELMDGSEVRTKSSQAYAWRFVR